MDLARLLDDLAGSEPFERLLLDRARPIVAHAEAGHDFVVAALARALDGPVLAIATGPREADALAHGAAAYLGSDRAAAFPAWEALPYEGINPGAEVASRRAMAVRALRGASGAFVLVAPAAAAVQRIAPDLGTHEPLVVARGSEAPMDALADRLVELGYVRVDVVEHMREDANDAMIVRATVELARNLRLRVVAEGVEASSIFDELANIGCDMAQGFHLAEPLPAIELTRWLEARGGASALVTPTADASPSPAGRAHLQVV